MRPLLKTKNHSRPPAYRLIFNFYHNHGEIMAEYTTAEELWEYPFIHRYFSSFNLSVSEFEYFENYLNKIKQNGLYKISNLYCVIYCEITKKGVIRPLIPSKE